MPWQETEKKVMESQQLVSGRTRCLTEQENQHLGHVWIYISNGIIFFSDGSSGRWKDPSVIEKDSLGFQKQIKSDLIRKRNCKVSSCSEWGGWVQRKYLCQEDMLPPGDMEACDELMYMKDLHTPKRTRHTLIIISIITQTAHTCHNCGWFLRGSVKRGWLTMIILCSVIGTWRNFSRKVLSGSPVSSK